MSMGRISLHINSVLLSIRSVLLASGKCPEEERGEKLVVSSSTDIVLSGASIFFVASLGW